MPILFAGTEQDAVKGGASVTTNPLFYDAEYSRSAIQINMQEPAGFSCISEITDSFWVGYTMVTDATPGYPIAGTALRFLSSYNEVALQITVASNTATASLYNDVGESSESTSFNWVGNNIKTRYDFHVYNENNNGVVDCYIDDLLVSSGTVTGVHRGIKHIEISGPSSNGSAYVSEIISSTDSVLSMRVKTLPPISDGSNTAWSGDYTSISDVTENITGISSIVTDAIETYLHDQIGSGTTIRAVVIGAIVSSGHTQGVSAVLGSTEQTFNLPLSTGFAQNISIFEINPNTGLAYTAEELNSMEFGLINKAAAA